MKILITSTLVSLTLLVFSGCASIVSKSNWPVSIDSRPSGATVSIVNRKGIEVYNGKTPAALKLKSGSKFFSRESYTLTFTLDGYKTEKVNLECKVNGWYWGNLLIGGVIGMLIIDPATGAMYKLDSETVDVGLRKEQSNSSSTLNILNKNDLPENMKPHLVKIN